MPFGRTRGICLAALLAASGLLSGCATEKATQFAAHLPPPSASTLGPEFEVIKGSRYSYDVDGVADKAGRVHLVVGKLAEARHLVVGPNGVEQDETIVGGERNNQDLLEQQINFPDPLQRRVALVDIATDRAGNLHAIVNAFHYAKIDGKWVGRQPTPWQAGRVKPLLNEWEFFDGVHPFFVKNMPDLTWAFYVYGTDLSLGYGISWVGGGPGPVDLRRLVVVPEQPEYRHWFVLGAEGDKRTRVVVIGADHQNMLSAVYSDGWDFSNLYVVGYARFRPDAACPPLWNKALADRIGLKNAPAISLCPIQQLPLVRDDGAHAVPASPKISSYRIPSHVAHLFLEQDSWLYYGLDSHAGSLLVANMNGWGELADADGKSTWLPRMPISHAGFVFASTGRGRFSVLATSVGVRKKGDQPVYYLEYRNKAWSAPVEIGTYSYPPGPFLGGGGPGPFNPGKDVYKIIPDNHGHALLLWPHEDALVGRWVTLK